MFCSKWKSIYRVLKGKKANDHEFVDPLPQEDVYSESKHMFLRYFMHIQTYLTLSSEDLYDLLVWSSRAAK